MDTQPLTKEQVVARLEQARKHIQGLGVRRVALFGSVVRGQASPLEYPRHMHGGLA